MDSDARYHAHPRRRISARAALLVAALAASSWSDIAVAQAEAASPSATPTQEPRPSASSIESARNLMDIGHHKFARGDFAAALDAYRAANDIMHVSTTGLGVGRALIKLNRLLEARSVLLAVSRLPPRPNESKPLLRGRRNAAKLQNDLADMIPSLRVEISAPKDVKNPKLVVNGELVPAALIGQPQKMDPGEHQIELSAPTYKSDKQTIQLVVSQQRTVRLTLSEKSDASSSNVFSKFFASTPTMSLIGFGVAGAGIIAGTVTGGLALGAASEAKAGCQGDLCPAANETAAKSAVKRSKPLAHVSTASFAIAGAGAIVGVLGMVLIGSDETSDEEDQASIQPVLGLGYGGLHGRF